MKKIFFIAILLATISSVAQEQRTNNQNHFIAKKYTNDVILKNDPSINQRNVKLSVAFNGWLYSAFSTFNSSNNSGGITIRVSKDDGVNWSTVDSYSYIGVNYPTFDFIVSGTDTNNLFISVVGARHDITSGINILFVDRYNATNYNFLGTNYYEDKGVRQIYDVSMATDYRFPAFGSSPYSVAFVYSVYSPIMDSINYICSTDAGVTWGVSQNISTSGGYFRKVSLAYGRSASASNGRYFAAWEQLGSSAARNGHIYTSRSSSTIIDSWISPINLDSVSTTMINLCRNPSIAVQYNNTDNDSSSVSAVVLVDRDYIGDGSDYDLLGFYNKRAHYTNYWYRLDIVNSGENDMFPDVTYDPGANNFLAVYFDSSNFKLPYIVNNMNLVNPSTWTTINPQYNDNLNLTSPFPRVEINPVLNQAAHVWIAEGSSPNGVAMFDAEYAVSNVGVQNISQEIDEISIFPNPIKNYFNISLKSKSSDLITVNIFDLTGKIVFSQLSNVIEGHNLLKVNIDEIASGNYIVNLQGQKINSNIRILVK